MVLQGKIPGWGLGLVACLAALPAAAQYPGQIANKGNGAPTLRSVVVVEWTGSLAKPDASRVIPVSVFDGQALQDGGVYLARPQPLALDGQVEYVIQKDGKEAGLFDIHNAAEQGGAQGGYWIGFGSFKPLPAAPTPEELARRAASQKIDVEEEDNDKPILHRKHHAGDDSGDQQGKASAPDPGRPTLHKGGDAGSDTGSSSGPAAAPDPDRPRLHSNDSANTNSGDRPKLHERPDDDEAHVSSLPDITDPNRPRLKRGKPAEYAGGDTAPTLMGLPAEMEQEVAVSDPRPVKDHPWDFAWANPGDEAKMKAAMEDIARKALGLDQPAAPARPAPRRTSSSVHRKASPPPPAPEPAPLRDEQFRVFELAYGGGATMVLSARTEGSGADEKFVTLVAQPDLYGGVVVLLKNVTDAAHLDLKPRMHLVDAVDAEADNRGELLFELRGQMQRQFALYRVYRGQATQIFLGGAIGTGNSAE